MEEKLEKIKQSVSNEIKEKQIILINLEINSKEYNDCLDFILSKKRLLDMIEDFKNNKINFLDIKKTTEQNNYLNELSQEDIKLLINIITSYNKKMLFFKDYGRTIEFPEKLTELKKETIFNDIKFNSIEHEEDLIKLYKFITSKKEEFNKTATELKSRIRIIDKDSYNELFINQKNKVITKIEVLKNLENLDNKKLIDEIIKLHKEKKSLKTKVIKPKNINEHFDQINEKIYILESKIIKNIDSYLKFNFNLYKYKLNINIQEDNYENLVRFIFDIYDEIINMRDNYEQLLKAVKRERVIVSSCEKQVEANKTKLTSDLSALLNKKIINSNDYLSLTTEKINNIIAQIALYKELLKSYEKKEDISMKLS